MQSAQGESIDILVWSRFLHTRLKHAVDTVLVGFVVPRAVLVAEPLRSCIEEERFAMRRTHDDAETVGYHLVLRHLIERRRAVVHGRTQIVSIEAEQQFTHGGIGARAEVAAFLLVIVLRPLVESPVLVVDEYTAELHAWLL